MILALLRPYLGTTDITVPASNDDYMFVMDVSRSMFAKDVPPSRIELAKRKLKDLIDEFMRMGTPHRYGITLFAGYSYLLCPITDDTTVVKQFISEISPEMVTSLGSNLEAGMSTALGRFTESNAQNARILLVSDGEDDHLSLSRVLELIKSKGIRVDVLGIGTTMGAPIELEDGSFVRDSSGSVVQSKLGEDSLKAIAEAGSGSYVRATVDDRDIAELTKASLSLQQGAPQGTRTIRTYDEFGSWLALGALLALLGIAAAPRSGTLLRVLALIVACSNAASATPLPPPGAGVGRAAYDLYSEGKFKESADAFKKALESTPNDPALRQGLASALFKSGRYREAQQLFNALASQATNGRDYFENTYNEGNALLALKRYQDAIDAFTKALDVKPDDERAMHNKAVAKALLEEERNKPTPTPTPTRDPNSSPQPSPSPQTSPDSSKDSDEQQQPEQQQQQGQPSPSPAASPEASTQPQQSPSSSTEASPTPNPAASPESQPSGSPVPTSEASPQPTPAEGNPTQSPEKEQDDRLKENQEEDSPPQQNVNSKPADLDTRSPSQKEAEAWLESLPESPLLIRRERNRAPRGGQTW
jgi:Ca-activated chloride channel family protein